MSILHSSLIKRLSCGCNPATDKHMLDDINSNIDSYDANSLSKKFKDIFMNHYYNTFYSNQLFDVLDKYFSIFMDILYTDHNYTNDELIYKTEQVLNSDIIIYYFSHNKMIYLMNIFSNFMLNLKIPDDKHHKLESVFNTILAYLSFYISNEYISEVKLNKENVWQSMRLTRDTLLTAYDDEKCYKLIAENLCTYSGFKSVYVYLYDEIPTVMDDGMWHIPKYILLQTYCKDGKARVLDDSKRILPSHMIFNNRNTPNERRHTMVLTPLFTNETQHGLFLCETDISKFNKVYSSSLQLSTSLKFLSLMKQEMAIQNRLEQTMSEIREKNDQLNAISVTDELTGLYNRRGFFEAVKQLINNKSYSGKKGLIGYIDMDNLKQVNDRFGHKEGDYSLVSIANTLRKSFPKGTVIARIGGDEYAIFTPDMKDVKMKNIIESMSYYQDRLNETNNKPYYIDFSIGIQELVLSDHLNVEAELTKADSMLYEDKKNKRKDVTKTL
jgi:diguanylate cyclase (GGDEF)-like protein